MCIFGIAFTLFGIFFGVPRWLPESMRRMRMRLFRQMFGAEGIELPNKNVGPAESLRVYSHSDAYYVSKGSTLSELFWYWFYPGSHLHQELIERGHLHDLVNRTTRKVLAIRPEVLLPLLGKHFNRYAVSQIERGDWSDVRLTRWLFPVFAGVQYELIFGREASDETIALLTDYVSNDLRTRKCLELRNLPLRLRALERVKVAIDGATRERLQPLSQEVDDQALAEYVLVNFFASGVIQLSEAVAHFVLEVARREDIRGRLETEGFHTEFFPMLIKEMFRVYPLFDSSHRILREDVTLENGDVLKKGTVLYLNHVAYNRAAYADGEAFRPERWRDRDLEKINIAFGVQKNRPCPAFGIAGHVVRLMVPVILSKFDVLSTANHARPLVNFGPCLVKPRGARLPVGRMRLAVMKMTDDWRAVLLAARQVVLGRYMIWDALRTRPCTAYFSKENVRRLPIAQPIESPAIATLCPHLAAASDTEAA